MVRIGMPKPRKHRGADSVRPLNRRYACEVASQGGHQEILLCLTNEWEVLIALGVRRHRLSRRAAANHINIGELELHPPECLEVENIPFNNKYYKTQRASHTLVDLEKSQ